MAIESAPSASASLAPGFRFHPTDEELVRYYLRRKICGKAFRFDAISEIDIYKVEPWDLPDKSRLKSRDLEWYFFSFLDRKYGNGSKTNRATDRGYWKTTGKDRAVYHKSVVVGMKKTLVYHNGRAPRGERTNWVMHEYRLIDDNLQGSAGVKDAIVLCRIFRKSGAGPKNGEKYGAPFVDEEWDDDEELTLVPKEEVLAGGIACLDGNDLDQILGTDDPSEVSPPPLNLPNGDDNNIISESSYEAKNPELCMGENNCDPQKFDDPKFFDLPVQQYDVPVTVKREYIGESSNNSDPADVDYYLDESFLDAKDNFSFLETKDLQNPVEADACGFDMLEEYLTYFDADGGDISQYMNLYSPTTRGDEHLVSDPTSFSNEYMKEETLQATKLLGGHDSDVASSSSEQDHAKFESDIQYPFMKRAGHILDRIPAPPAFASEFPTKEALLHLKSATSQSPSSVRVTAGMIQINNITSNVDWSLGKHGGISLILSFGPRTTEHDDADAETTMDKAATSVEFLGLFCFMFIWVLILSMSYKIGKYICAN